MRFNYRLLEKYIPVLSFALQGRWWILILAQYVALCGALTTQAPAQWPADPIFSLLWGQSNFNGAVSNTVTPSVSTDVITNPPTYNTASPVPPLGPLRTTEPSISLRELIRLAFGNFEATDPNVGATTSTKVTDNQQTTKTTKSSLTSLTPPEPGNNTQETTGNTKPPSTKVETQPVLETKPAIVITTTSSSSTTTTTPVPPTTTTAKATPAPTVPPSLVKASTEKPLAQMTLGEILRLQAKQNAEENQATVKATGRPRGCYYKGKYYKPLSEIEKGQTGTWCYGSYCNHEGTVVHWDDHKCTVEPTTPSPLIQQLPPQTPFDSPIQSTGNVGGAIAESANTNSGGFGCIHDGRWFAPGTDVESYRDYGRCWGSFCDLNSRIVQWNDRCSNTVAPPTTRPAMGGFGGMGTMGGMSGFGGMPGMGSGIDLSALGLSGDISSSLGMGGGMGMGMGGMGGEMGGSLGMGGELGGGMGGGQSLSMRQLQQLDLI